MIYSIDSRIVFDSHDKNSEIMITIHSTDYNTTPFTDKLIYGGNFIVGYADSYDDALIKAKDIKDKLDNIIKEFKRLPINESRINELKLTLVREVSHLEQATE